MVREGGLMKERIEVLIKTKIGTSYVFDESRGYPVFKLTGYGLGVFITYDEVALDKHFVKVIYASQEVFTVIISHEHPNLDEMLVASVKMMIEVRKKVK